MMDAEKEVLAGYNAGYLIEKYRPELAKQLTAGLNGVDMPYIEGFVAGSRESTVEKAQNRTIALQKLKDLAKGTIPNSPKKGREKGDKEMDIER